MRKEQHDYSEIYALEYDAVDISFPDTDFEYRNTYYFHLLLIFWFRDDKSRQYTCLALTKDGSKVVIGSSKGTFRFIDTNTWNVLDTVKVSSSILRGVELHETEYEWSFTLNTLFLIFM